MLVVGAKGVALAALVGTLLSLVAGVAAQAPQPGFDVIYSEGYLYTVDITSAPGSSDEQRAR